MSEQTTAAPTRGRALRRRAVWVVADQAVSSLANAALTVVIARTVSPAEYGAFALAFSVYSLVVALSQAVAGQVVVIHYSGAAADVIRRASASAAGTALLVGTVSAAVLLPLGLALGAPVRGVLLAVGLLLPALLVQDAWRTVFVARGTPAAAFVNDVVWIVLQAASIGVLVVVGVDTAHPYVLAWAGAAAVAALVGARQNGAPPSPRTAPAFLRGHTDVSLPTLANSAAILGALQLSFVLIAVVAAVSDVGALRAAQTLLGPLNILGFAATSFAIPEIVRREPGRRGLVLAALAISGTLVVVDLAWGAVLLLLPTAAGEALLGDTWAGAREALPGMIAYTCLIAATAGATAVMRAVNRSVLAFWTSAVLGPLVLVLSVLGAATGGALGASLGFAAAGALVLPLCWVLLARAARLGRRPTAAVR
ncbi:hypothetical protein [uncultured Pseudokineococcus sp.]|uniref:hypothetical protein n=1 Tax=uncultured Pseudokineococcus sp. TaxID=1642928 RepID=UPI00261748C9|nr:hypothetical protein [uncultured Pseudokineococcus sp.]